VLCAADWKARAIAILHERKVDLNTNATIDLSRIMGMTVPDLGVAETAMMLPAPAAAGGQQMVIMALACWSHAQAIQVMDSALAVAGAGAGAGFAGAVDLGQRGR
jgi:hypothetical protein